MLSELKNQHSTLGHFIRVHHLQGFLSSLSNEAHNRLGSIGGKAFSSIAGILSDVVSLLVVVVLTFMMLVEGQKWLSVLSGLFVSENKTKEVNVIANEMYRVIRGYVNGQVLLALIAAILMGPVLFMMHVSFPIAMMAIIFICGLVPVIGHAIGALIVTIVAVFHSLTAALVVLILYIIYINIENYLLQPRIQSNTTNMSPLLVLVSVIVGINFGGIFGGLVAIPVAGCIRVLIIELLEHKKLLPKNFLDEAKD